MRTGLPGTAAQAMDSLSTHAPGPRLSPARRAHLASAYAADAEGYDAVRPAYPWPVVRACLEGLHEQFGERHPRVSAADIGAGSGIFTEQLRESAERAGVPLEVTAVDVSEAMLRRASERGLSTRLASGEDTGLESQSFQLVTYAQAWHWVDADRAGREAARLVEPKGRLALVWNQLDVRVPWVHRLSRIMRSGDVFFTPEQAPRPGGRWRSPSLHTAEFLQPLTPAEVVALARTRSSYRTSSPEQRARCERNIRDYLCRELGSDPGQTLDIPYLSFAWTFVRSSRVDPEDRSPRA